MKHTQTPTCGFGNVLENFETQKFMETHKSCCGGALCSLFNNFHVMLLSSYERSIPAFCVSIKYIRTPTKFKQRPLRCLPYFQQILLHNELLHSPHLKMLRVISYDGESVRGKSIKLAAIAIGKVFKKSQHENFPKRKSLTICQV